MTTETYLTVRRAPLGAWIGITDGSRHVLAPEGDPGVPAAAQRRLNAAKASGRAGAATDLAGVAGWLDEHVPGRWVQAELFAA